MFSTGMLNDDGDTFPRADPKGISGVFAGKVRAKANPGKEKAKALVLAKVQVFVQEKANQAMKAQAQEKEKVLRHSLRIHVV